MVNSILTCCSKGHWVGSKREQIQLGYIRDHWRGRHSLGWSFWINLVAIRVIVFTLEFALRGILDHSEFLFIAAKTIFFLVFHILVLGWQIIGTVRAAEAHMQATGSSLLLWSCYLACLASLIMTANVVLSTNNPIQSYDFLRTMADVQSEQRKSQYQFQYDKATGTLKFSGDFVIGVRRAFTSTFKRESNIRRVILESPGGSIYEARGVARILLEKKVETHIQTMCASACALAYLAGKTRSIAPEGRLGFHKYDFNSANRQPHPMIKLADEHDADRNYMRKRGLSESFLEKVFKQDHANIWFPATTELLQARAVHAIVPGVTR